MVELFSERRRIVDSARSWLGTPYKHQASCKSVGCDCLGLVRGVWRETQGAEPEPVPAYTSTWAETGNVENLIGLGEKYFVETENPRAGDIIIFRMRRNGIAKHVGVLSDDSKFIHAYDNACVVETWMSKFWSKCFVSSFVFPSVFESE